MRSYFLIPFEMYHGFKIRCLRVLKTAAKVTLGLGFLQNEGRRIKRGENLDLELEETRTYIAPMTFLHFFPPGPTRRGGKLR